MIVPQDLKKWLKGNHNEGNEGTDRKEKWMERSSKPVISTASSHKTAFILDPAWANGN